MWTTYWWLVTFFSYSIDSLLTLLTKCDIDIVYHNVFLRYYINVSYYLHSGDIRLDIGIFLFCTLPSPDSISNIGPVMKVFGPDSSSSVPSHNNVMASVTAIRDMVNSDTVRVIFIVHGFTGNIDNQWMHTMKNEILQYNRDQVVVLVGWANGASPQLPCVQDIYRKAAANTQEMGKYIGDIARNVKNSESRLEIYGIGHSLGAHVMGKAGRHSGVFTRITGTFIIYNVTISSTFLSFFYLYNGKCRKNHLFLCLKFT